jgi:hypothetical protein
LGGVGAEGAVPLKALLCRCFLLNTRIPWAF